MSNHPGERGGYWPAVVLIGLTAAAGYAADLFLQPACGAPGNTALGRSNSYVPWVLLAAEVVCTVTAGRIARRRAPTVFGGLLLGTALAAGVAAIVFLCWFASGDCGE